MDVMSYGIFINLINVDLVVDGKNWTNSGEKRRHLGVDVAIAGRWVFRSSLSLKRQAWTREFGKSSSEIYLFTFLDKNIFLANTS